MLSKLLKRPLGLGVLFFIAMMLSAGELSAQVELVNVTSEALFAYPPKSSLRAACWLRTADTFNTEGNAEQAVLYYTKAAEKNDARGRCLLSLCYSSG